MRPIENFKKQFESITPEKQLEEWVKGNPIHNTSTDECCPDFSCCRGIIAEKDVRERFAKAFENNDESTYIEMLGMFLGSALQEEGTNAHISTGKPGGEA